jgi:hypothetical protein
MNESEILRSDSEVGSVESRLPRSGESGVIDGVGSGRPVRGGQSSLQTKLSLVLLGFFALVILLCVVLGVRYKRLTDVPITGGIFLPERVDFGGIKNVPGKRFAGIEATRTYQNDELIGEIKKVLQASSLPGDVFKKEIPSDKNIALYLKREFRMYHDNHGELEHLRKQSVFVDGKVNEESLREGEEVLSRVDYKRLTVRKLLDDEAVAFSFEIVRSEEFGDVPDISAAGYLDDYLLLEEYAIGRALRDGNISNAVISIAYIFRIAQLVAEVKSLPVRFQAAKIRTRCVELMQNIVFAKSFSESDLKELYAIVLEQLDTWCPESNAFIGYRASGMKVFNMVLSYGIDYAFEPSELEELARRDKDRFSYRINSNWAWDHVFFLKSMQTIIGDCKVPYYQRVERLDIILRELKEKYNTPEDLIVSNFLLREVPRYMQYYAMERTKCELVALTMAHSLKYSQDISETVNKTIDAFRLEPMTGKPYYIRHIVNEQEPKVDIIWGSYFGNLKPFRIPDYSKFHTTGTTNEN